MNQTQSLDNPAQTAAASQEQSQKQNPSSKDAYPEHPDGYHLAVFDLDGTSIDGQSGELFTRYLFSHGLVSPWNILRLIWWGLRYRLHLPHRQEEAHEVLFKAFDGKDFKSTSELMRNFHDEKLLPRYRPEVFDEIKKRKEEGCIVLLVTATFSGIAEVAGEYLGVDGVAATHMALDVAGLFTGGVEGEVVQGEAKLLAVYEWAKAKIPGSFWELSYAYGDHHSDRALLQAAQTGFAVCPGVTLKRHARKRGIQILHWSSVK